MLTLAAARPRPPPAARAAAGPAVRFVPCRAQYTPPLLQPEHQPTMARAWHAAALVVALLSACAAPAAAHVTDNANHMRTHVGDMPPPRRRWWS